MQNRRDHSPPAATSSIRPLRIAENLGIAAQFASAGPTTLAAGVRVPAGHRRIQGSQRFPAALEAPPARGPGHRMRECRWGPDGYADDDIRVTDGKADSQVPGPNRATEAVAPQGILRGIQHRHPAIRVAVHRKHPPHAARGVAFAATMLAARAASAFPMTGTALRPPGRRPKRPRRSDRRMPRMNTNLAASSPAYSRRSARGPPAIGHPPMTRGNFQMTRSQGPTPAKAHRRPAKAHATTVRPVRTHIRAFADSSKSGRFSATRSVCASTGSQRPNRALPENPHAT
jgi:hypothetical protein